MEYTVAKLATLAGISTRTLRYYDSIGLLAPARISSSGYRIYGSEEATRLQHILFYRELEVPLEEIGAILAAPEYNPTLALRKHREALAHKAERLNRLIATLDKTIAANERNEMMKDSEKFEGFKNRLIAENEANYGAEIREKYGDDVVDASNEKLRNTSKEELLHAEEMAAEILALLDAAYPTGDPACPQAVQMAALHKEWLCCYWPEYNAQAHAQLCDMYVQDARFASYYDRGTPGKAGFLRDAVKQWLEA